MPCKEGTKLHSGLQDIEAKNDEFNKIPKTKYACIVEAHESTRHRLQSSLPKNHEDHTAGKWYTSMTHHNLVHQFIPLPQAMKIRGAKAAEDKEWKKLETILAWQLEKVKSKKEVILEAQREQKGKSTLLHWWTSVTSRMRSSHFGSSHFWLKPFLFQTALLARVRLLIWLFIFCLVMPRKGWQSVDVASGWVQITRGSAAQSCHVAQAGRDTTASTESSEFLFHVKSPSTRIQP